MQRVVTGFRRIRLPVCGWVASKYNYWKLTYRTVLSRLALGWTLAEALSLPRYYHRGVKMNDRQLKRFLAYPFLGRQEQANISGRRVVEIRAALGRR